MYIYISKKMMIDLWISSVYINLVLINLISFVSFLIYEFEGYRVAILSWNKFKSSWKSQE